MSSISDLSYYEMRNICGSKLFGSKYPSVNTTAPDSDALPKVGTPLFTESITDSKMENFLSYLRYNDFGFFDFIQYLLPSSYTNDGKNKNYNVSNLCEMLNSIILIDYGKRSEYDIIAVFKSNIPEYSSSNIELRLHNETLPQKAFDTAVYFVNRKEKTVTTPLGYKKKTDPISINEYSILSLGLYGYLYGAGEHVDANSEGKLVNELLKKHHGLTDSDEVIRYKDKLTMKLNNRALAEELGASLDGSANSVVEALYLVGVHDAPGRDPRYWSHFFNRETFGYERPSQSILFAAVVVADKSPQLSDPSDLNEVDKPHIVPFSYVENEFNVNGKAEPAFPCHVEQFKIIARKFPAIFRDLNIPDAGNWLKKPY